MQSRILEAEDTAKPRPLNHGKFQIIELGDAVFSQLSTIHLGHTVMEALPVVRRLGPIKRNSLWVMDLQTQEGMLFSPTWSDKQIRQRFLCHPLHVCILYFPMLMWLARNASDIWTHEGALQFDLEEVLNQPGRLVDATGTPVRSLLEWSKRAPAPIAARYRNRDVPEEELLQGELTDEELATMRKYNTSWPEW